MKLPILLSWLADRINKHNNNEETENEDEICRYLAPLTKDPKSKFFAAMISFTFLYSFWLSSFAELLINNLLGAKLGTCNNPCLASISTRHRTRAPRTMSPHPSWSAVWNVKKQLFQTRNSRACNFYGECYLKVLLKKRKIIWRRGMWQWTKLEKRQVGENIMRNMKGGQYSDKLWTLLPYSVKCYCCSMIYLES